MEGAQEGDKLEAFNKVMDNCKYGREGGKEGESSEFCTQRLTGGGLQTRAAQFFPGAIPSARGVVPETVGVHAQCGCQLDGEMTRQHLALLRGP